MTYSDTVAPIPTITALTAAGGQTAAVSGTGGTNPGDAATVSVVLCTSASFPCAAGNTKATLVAAVDPTTGAWSVTSAALGTVANLYAQAGQTDATANVGKSTVAGPVAI